MASIYDLEAISLKHPDITIVSLMELHTHQGGTHSLVTSRHYMDANGLEYAYRCLDMPLFIFDVPRVWGESSNHIKRVIQ